MAKAMISVVGDIDKYLERLGFEPSNDEEALENIKYEVISGYLTHLRSEEKEKDDDIIITLEPNLSLLNSQSLQKNGNGIYYLSGILDRRTTMHLVSETNVIVHGLADIITRLKDEHLSEVTDLKTILCEYLTGIASETGILSYDGWLMGRLRKELDNNKTANRNPAFKDVLLA